MEDALVEALRNERARRETMDIIRVIRHIGAEETILKLAGCILMAPKAPAKEGRL
jgi:hypothetical protein